MVSILPMVDLLGNTGVDWFCILSYFRLDTLDYAQYAEGIYQIIHQTCICVVYAHMEAGFFDRSCFITIMRLKQLDRL